MAQNKQFEKTSKPLKDSVPPPLPFAHHIKEGKKEKKEEKKDRKKVDDTYSESMRESLLIIEQIKQKHNEVDLMINEVLEKTGWTPKYLKTFLDNPNNFSNEEWEGVQKQRKELLDSTKTPKELQEQEEKRKKTPLAREQTHDPKVAKERRSKTVAARRNWLPMR